MLSKGRSRNTQLTTFVCRFFLAVSWYKVPCRQLLPTKKQVLVFFQAGSGDGAALILWESYVFK